MRLLEVTNQSKSYKCFTIIELLVVIAVIAVLASLLFPALSRSKTNGIRLYCQNNLRQIGMALNLYVEDNLPYPPIKRYLKGSPTSVSLWNAYLLPLVDSNRVIFYCPSFPEVFRWTTNKSKAGYFYPTNIEGNRPFCYALNANGVAAADLGLGKISVQSWVRSILGRNPDEIAAPSEMIAIGDDSCFTNLVLNVHGWKVGGWGAFELSYSGGPDPSFIGSSHDQGANMVFLDLHVEWQKWWKWIEFTDEAARRWNYDNKPHEEYWKK